MIEEIQLINGKTVLIKNLTIEADAVCIGKIFKDLEYKEKY